MGEGLHTLFTINVFFSRGGSVWKQMLPLSAFAQWWTFSFYAFYDLFWFLGLFQIARNEFKELKWYCKHRSCGAIWDEYVGFWNMVDWATIIMGTSLCVITGNCWVHMANVNYYLADVPAFGNDDYVSKVSLYMKSLENVVDYYS